MAGHPGEGVHLGVQGPQAGEQLRAALVGAEDGAVDHDQLAAAQERPAARASGAAASPRNAGGDLVGSGRRPGGPLAQHRLDVGEVPDQHAGVRRRDVEHRELEGGDDAEAAAAAAHGPEQLGVGASASARTRAAVGDDQLDRGEAVGGQAVLAGVPADAAAEGVAGDADVGGGAVQDGHAVGGRGVDRGLPDGAALDADDAAGRVGDRGVHLGRADEDDVVEALGGERTGVVTGALRRDPEAGSAAARTTVGDLGGRAREGDGGRPLVDGDVPGEAGGVVPGVAGQVDAASEQAAEGVGGGAAVAGAWSALSSMVMVMTPVSGSIVGGTTMPPALGVDWEPTWSARSGRGPPMLRAWRSASSGRSRCALAGAPVDLGTPKQRALVAALALLARPAGVGRRDRRPAVGRLGRRRA